MLDPSLLWYLLSLCPLDVATMWDIVSWIFMSWVLVLCCLVSAKLFAVVSRCRCPPWPRRAPQQQPRHPQSGLRTPHF